MDNESAVFTDVFSGIYRNSLWGNGSGSGSQIENAFTLVGWMQYFIVKNKITSIIDCGCGDWQWMQFVSLSNINYLGLDCVPEVIEKNRIQFGKSNILFEVADATQFSQTADLVIFKDVLQHLPNKSVKKAMDNALNNAKYVCVINGISGISSDGQPLKENTDIKVGDYRPLNLTVNPFNYVGNVFLEYKPNDQETSKRIEIFSTLKKKTD